MLELLARHAIAFLAKSGGTGGAELKLVGANPHVAKHYATRAILKRERTRGQLVIVSVDCRLSVQFHDEMAAVRRDLVMVPTIASFKHDFRARDVDDAPGSVRRVGPLIEDIHLVARCGPDLDSDSRSG